MSILKQISEYNGYNKFMNSLRSQLMFKGTLSDKQISATQSFFGVAQLQTEAVAPQYTYKKGDNLLPLVRLGLRY